MRTDTYPVKGGQPFNWSFIALIIVWIVIFFSSCSTAKELIDKAEKKDPAAVAKYTREKYPCEEVLLPTTVTEVHDTLIYIECPETTPAAEYMAGRTDTIRVAGPMRTIRIPVTLPVRTEYITRWFEDSAYKKVAAFELSKMQAENQKLTEKLGAMTSSRNWFRKWFWILIIAIGVFVVIKLVIK